MSEIIYQTCGHLDAQKFAAGIEQDGIAGESIIIIEVTSPSYGNGKPSEYLCLCPHCATCLSNYFAKKLLEDALKESVQTEVEKGLRSFFVGMNLK